MLFGKLQDEIVKIWDSMKKPAEFNNTPITQFFEFQFFALPHMKLEKEKFAREVQVLRDR